MKTVVVEHQQSLLDVSAQVYGTPESVIELAMLNGLSITDAVTPGLRLNYNNNNNPVARYFENRQYHPATDAANRQEHKDEGIDFWGIEVDFVVQ